MATIQFAEGVADIVTGAPAAVASYIGCVIGSLLANLGGSSPVSGVTPAPDPQQSTQNFQPTGDGCFAADTQVLMANGSWKLISDVKATDRVRSGERTDNIAVVMDNYSLQSANVHEIRLSGVNEAAARSVQATAEHLFWVDGRGWTAVSRLQPGDWLFNSQGERVRVTANLPIHQTMRVYTLRLGWDTSFYANDVLVHDVCGQTLPATAVSTTLKTQEVAK
jgi:nitrogen fixation protein FixH